MRKLSGLKPLSTALRVPAAVLDWTRTGSRFTNGIFSHKDKWAAVKLSSSPVVTFIYRNAVRWGLSVIKLRKAPVFCFCPLFPFCECIYNATTSWLMSDKVTKTKKNKPFNSKWSRREGRCIWTQEKKKKACLCTRQFKHVSGLLPKSICWKNDACD